MKKTIILFLGVICSIGYAFAGTTAPTGGPHTPGTTSVVTTGERNYEVFFSNNAVKTSLLVGSNTSSTTETTSTTSWCNIGSSCGSNNNNISTAFTLDEFVNNVKSSNNKAIRVQSMGASEKNIVMVVKGYDAIAVLAKSNDINVYAEEYNTEKSSYGNASSLTVKETANKSSHYKRMFELSPAKQYRLTIAYGATGSTNKDIVAFSLRVPQHSLKLKDYGWASMYLDFPAEVPTGATAYWASAASSTSGTITLQEIAAGSVIPEGTGVVVKGSGGETYNFAYSSTSADPVDNLFSGVVTNTSVAAHTTYVLAGGDESSCTFKYYGQEGGSNVTLNAYKAYLPVGNVATSSPERIRFVIEGENNATAIEESQSTDEVRKFIQNGVMYIRREGVTYDALGRVVR